MSVTTIPSHTLTVSEVAAAGGVAPSAVRFYEQHGVIHAERTAGDQRRFTDAAACRIRVAKLAQRVGLTVREIAAVFADLPDDPQPADWARIADFLITEAESRAAALKQALTDMHATPKLCDLHPAP